MQSGALAYTVCLHVVRLQSNGGGGDNINQSFWPQAIELEPIVVFSSADTRTSGRGMESIIEQYTPLKSLLQCFCRRLLVKQSERPSYLGSASCSDVYLVNANSPVAEEGLFLQVPSRQFVSECVCSASSGVVMDVVNYNSLLSRWCNGSDADATDACDEGYMYGYVQFIPVGHAAEGLLLTIVSAFPLFNLLRTVVVATVPHIARAARTIHGNCCAVQHCERSESIASAFDEVMAPLSDLVDARSAACNTSAKNHFSIRFPHANVSVVRPDDTRIPFINTPMSILFLSFSYDALRVIHSLLLQGRRLVLIGVTPQHASACVVSLQAVLIPFIWTLPIVPYMPPEACNVIDAMGSTGFILGSTAEIVPPLMLRGSQPKGQRCDTAGARRGDEKTKEDQSRIWFADARTGLVGVSPSGADHLPFAMLDLVPSSDKVKEAMKRAVSKEQRIMFRVALGSAAVLTSDESLSRYPHSVLLPCPPAAMVDEVHGALLEYNVYHLVGNYRKGMFHVGTNNVSCGTRTSHLQGKAAFVIDYTRFLPGNLDNNVGLAQCIAGTRMYRHWEDAVLSLETLGVLRSLLGEFVRSRARSCKRGAKFSSLSGKETLASHYYLSNARMVGMMCLFYSRCARRFPELYSEWQGSDLAWLSEGTRVANVGRSEVAVALTIAKGGGGGGGGGSGSTSSSSGSNPGGKGLMRTLLSKATKAVKSSLVTHHHQSRIPVQVFVQAYGSFANKINYEMDPSKPATLNKEFKHRAAAVAASRAPGLQQDQSTLPPSPHASPPTPVACDLEDDIYGTCSGFFSDLDGDGPRRLGITAGESGFFIVCRQLPLDVIHQFEHYHTLLDPTKDALYSMGRRLDTTQALCTEQLRLFEELLPLFVADPNLLPVIETNRMVSLSTGTPARKPLHHSHDQEQDEKLEQQVQASLLGAGDGGARASSVPFEAQPLSFSMDLVTRPPELPPFPAAISPPPCDNLVTSQAAVWDPPPTANIQTTVARGGGGGGDLMDDLFAFSTPQQKPPASFASVPPDPENFFR